MPAPTEDLPDLFGYTPPPTAKTAAAATPVDEAQGDAPASPPSPRRAQAVEPALPLLGADIAAALPTTLRLGGSSWSFPGWAGQVWAKPYSERILAQRGLAAYAQHPLLRTVSIDRSFYRPLAASEYAVYAAQVPADFRFIVKAPSVVCDAQVRG